jgi:uncharacterized protein
VRSGSAAVRGPRARHRREDELRADLRSALDEDWFEALFIPPVLLDEEGCALWIEEMDFDPRPVFAQVRVPALAFFGAADSWTPVEPSVEAWRKARGDEVEIVVIPDAEHELTLPDGSLSEEYERKLVAWLTGLAGAAGIIAGCHTTAAFSKSGRSG